jgi:MinD superfamily P-loop ATPase
MKIAIASGKGGTGKTTLSTNLAHYLSQTEKVVLSDLDVEEPNSGLFIEGELINKQEMVKHIPVWKSEGCLLCNKCRELCNFNAVTRILDEIMIFPELCHSCYACSELCPTNSLPMEQKKMGELKHIQTGQLDFIESQLDVGEEQAVPLIGQTLDYIDEHFDENIIKLYDSPPGTSCPMIEAVKDADFIILITEPTPFGFHDLKLAVEVVRQLGKKFGVVINRDGLGNKEVEEFCQMENIPLLAKIPNHRKIAELYSSGKLLYNSMPDVKRELEKIHQYIKEAGSEI